MKTEKNFSNQSLCHCTNLRRASRAITQYYDEMLEPSGLKVTQYGLLNHIRRLGPLTMNELSQAMRLERTTLVRNLKPLEQMGLVTSFASTNSQARQLNLTEMGTQVLAAAAPYWNQAQQQLAELVSEEEEQLFKRVLRKIESLVP
ncbi:winged helix-turn-helix transcriptional regulator [bacterium BFN5]|nr:winged helix-turn-helix transcriptional regulator [bacterium BFN5]